jgi:hypothetical protein
MAKAIKMRIVFPSFCRALIPTANFSGHFQLR